MNSVQMHKPKCRLKFYPKISIIPLFLIRYLTLKAIKITYYLLNPKYSIESLLSVYLSGGKTTRN